MDNNQENGSARQSANGTPFIKRNFVRTTFIWPNGGVTTRVIDLNDSKSRLRFANLAAKCYACNGVVVCNGENDGQGTTKVSQVKVNDTLFLLDTHYTKPVRNPMAS